MRDTEKTLIDEYCADCTSPAISDYQAACARVDDAWAALRDAEQAQAELEAELLDEIRKHAIDSGFEIEGFVACRETDRRYGGEPCVNFKDTPGLYLVSTLLAHGSGRLCFHTGMGKDYGISGEAVAKTLCALFTPDELRHWQKHGLSAKR